MTYKSKKAAELFNKNFNCAQSVLAAFCEDYGVDIQTGFKLAAAFGGGVRSGEICGAVSGAAMVIGLKYGQFSPDDLESKSKCNAKTIEFITAFRKQNDSIVCGQLLGYDANDPEAREKNKVHQKQLCTGLVEYAAKLLEDLGY